MTYAASGGVFGTGCPSRLTEIPPGPEPDPITVRMISGAELTVLTESERTWFETSRDTYLEQTKFTQTTDLRDLDRLLSLELAVFRMTQHVAAGQDYDGYEIDEVLTRRNLREYSEQINRVKSSMGLNKAARDEAASGGDVSAFISDLKSRAKIFGIHREKQLGRALVLMNELSAIVGAYDRSDAEERARLGFTDEKEILEWVRQRMLPEYKELDEHFRENDQRYWIRSM